jgi:hypothetical protein
MKEDANVVTSFARRSMIMRTKPESHVVDPKARMCRFWSRLANRRLRRSKGNVVIPPRAIKFPDANGDQWKCDTDEETGMLDSQAPRMKKHVMAYQHMHTITPH